MPESLLFTPALIAFLKAQGYTHIQLRGIGRKADAAIHSAEENDDNFILVPWKEGISLFEEHDLNMEKIGSTEFTDMLDVEFGISFWVELPERVAMLYKYGTKTK
ncbi:MAG TPA: hypothetical protein VK645_12685 [Chitinophagaceae bacterium]|nr:hypothetical protein [Chitinophagaceae bacterium]